MHLATDPLVTRDQNHFNLLRLLAALGVIFTHSYALLGFAEHDLIAKATNGLLSFSRLGVYMFFVISGFLVANSFWHSPTIYNFFWKRFLRIFPALAVVLFLTTFIAGPLLSTVSFKEYFSRPGTYHYLIGGLSLYDTQYALPGVFKTNPHPGVNGSLWTLAYEWTCYVLLALLLIPFRNRRKTALIVLIATLMVTRLLIGRYQIFQVIGFLKLDSRQLLLFASYFFMGALGLELRKYLQFKPILAGLLITAFCVLAQINKNILFYAMLVLIPYVTLSIASMRAPKFFLRFTHIDYSYGMYIYAFPISQILVFYFRNYLSVPTLAITTIILTLPLAILSWHFIEKTFLRFKKTT